MRVLALANPVGFHRHEYRKWNQAPSPNAKKRLKDGLDIGVLKEEFPATQYIDAQHHGGEQQPQGAQSQASGPEGMGHLGGVVLALETGNEDLDAHTAPGNDHGEGEVNQPSVPCTVDFQFPGAAEEEIVRQDHEELHEAAQRNGHGDAQQVADSRIQGRPDDVFSVMRGRPKWAEG